MAVCDKGCGGTGWVTVDDMTRRKCICAYARELRAHLERVCEGNAGKDLVAATILESSPLYEPGGSDLTQSNLFIKTPSLWALYPHLKWVLTFKGLSFTTKLVTDMMLKGVWVGDESYAMRAKSKRDNVETFNSISDLIGEHVHLAIIQLGVVQKNVRLPEIILEALKLREALSLPTWLLETPDKPFGPGAPAYSYETAKYIEENFEVLTIRTIHSATPAPAPPPVKRAPVEDVSLDDVVPPESPPAVSESYFKEASRPEWDKVEARSKPRKKPWNPRKPGGGGGGPLGDGML